MPRHDRGEAGAYQLESVVEHNFTVVARVADAPRRARSFIRRLDLCARSTQRCCRDLVRVAERGATLMPDRSNGNGPAAVERMAERKGFNTLTPRERDVLAQIVSGASNKEAGRSLKISPRTIEIHRARIMDKLGAKNAADLVRIAMARMRSASEAAADRSARSRV
jgi:DNA-binding CsgD family transcriptional regulator